MAEDGGDPAVLAAGTDQGGAIQRPHPSLEMPALSRVLRCRRYRLGPPPEPAESLGYPGWLNTVGWIEMMPLGVHLKRKVGKDSVETIGHAAKEVCVAEATQREINGARETAETAQI